MKKITKSLILAMAVLGSVPVRADTKTFEFHSGVCAGKTCSISIDSGRNVTVVSPSGERGHGLLYDGNRIEVGWRYEGCEFIRSSATLYYSQGGVSLVRWDDRKVWGPDVECGVDEDTIAERVADCAKLPGSSADYKGDVPGQKLVEWNLVSRARHRSSGRYYEVWKDSKTGLLWGDRLEGSYSHYDAIEIKDGVVKYEKACHSKEGRIAYARITEKHFGLPTAEEFREAEKDGIEFVLPNMPTFGRADEYFWTATLDSQKAGDAYFFRGGLSSASRNVGGWARCVGR